MKTIGLVVLCTIIVFLSTILGTINIETFRI